MIHIIFASFALLLIVIIIYFLDLSARQMRMVQIFGAILAFVAGFLSNSIVNRDYIEKINLSVDMEDPIIVHSGTKYLNDKLTPWIYSEKQANSNKIAIIPFKLKIENVGKVPVSLRGNRGKIFAYQISPGNKYFAAEIIKIRETEKGFILKNSVGYTIKEFTIDFGDLTIIESGETDLIFFDLAVSCVNIGIVKILVKIEKPLNAAFFSMDSIPAQGLYWQDVAYINTKEACGLREEIR